MNMQRKLAVAVTLGLGLCAGAYAGNTANQTVGYEVTAINELSISGNPGNLVVNTAVAGSQPTDATEATTTYNITTNGTNKKITAQLDTAMPANTTLKVALTAPAVGSSAGEVTLSATAADLVTGVTQVIGSGLSIAYRLQATVAAGVVGAATKTVTFTIADA